MIWARSLNMHNAIFRYIKFLGIRGLARAIEAKVFGKTTTCKIRHPDCEHPILIRIPSSDLPTFEQVFYTDEYHFTCTSPPKTIIDAGANIGLTSILLANKYPDSRIFAIEPEIRNFAMLELNVRQYPNIIPINRAVWHQKDKLTIADPGRGTWGFTTIRHNSISNSMEDKSNLIETLTIDELVQDYNLKEIDLLKIDIEGAELELFKHQGNWLSITNSIIIELHERFKPGCTEWVLNACHDFPVRWSQGENLYLLRPTSLIHPLTGKTP